MGKRGFTLIELITVIAMLTIVTGVLVAAFLAGSDVFSSEKDTMDLMTEGTKAMETMSGEIRNGRQVVTATSSVFTFWKQDTDNDGTRDEAETVTYLWDGSHEGKLYRVCLGVGRVIADKINGLAFSYNSSTLSLISEVTVNLTAGYGTQVQTFESTIKMRNI